MMWFAKAVLLGFVALGCVALAPAVQPAATFEVRRAESKPAEGLVEATVEGSKTKVYLHKEAALTAADVAGAKATGDGKNKPAIEITFTGAEAEKIAQAIQKK